MFLRADLKTLSFSQAHSMVEVGKNPWRSFCPTSLLKLGYLDMVAYKHVLLNMMTFEYFQEQKLHNSQGKHIPVSENIHSKMGYFYA